MDAWRRVQEVNLTSVYLCCKYVIPHMQRQVAAGQPGGSIINIASFVAVMGAATSQISYTASKGGVLAMSRELGVQFAREGIRVNALCPGPVNTPLLQELFAKDPERAARRLVHVPMGRFAEPEEIAAAIAFLASDDASFITAAAVPGGRRDLRRVRDPAVSRWHRDSGRDQQLRGASALGTVAAARRAAARSAYAEQVAAAGGVPVLLPPLPGETAAVRRLDAVILSGGGDLDPAGYGAAAAPGDDPGAAGTGPGRAGPAGRRAGRGPAGAGHLPRPADPQRVPGRHAASSTCRRRRAQRRAGHVRHATRSGSRRAAGWAACSGRRTPAASCGSTCRPRTTRPSAGCGAGLVATAWAADGTIEAVEAWGSGDGGRPGDQS